MNAIGPDRARSRHALLGTAMVLAGVLPLVGFLTLPAIGWPDISQGMSATEALPQVAENEAVFRLGFGALTLGGVFFLPAAVYLAGTLGGRFLMGLALVSATLRTLWYGSSLTVIPVLDGLWQDGDAATRAAVDVFYVGYNDLLSTVQEDIGVNIFGGLFTLLVGLAMWRRRSHPRWLAVLGAVSGGSFMISSAEMVGGATGDIVPTLGPALSSVWFIGLGVVELRRARVTAAEPVGA